MSLRYLCSRNSKSAQHMAACRRWFCWRRLGTFASNWEEHFSVLCFMIPFCAAVARRVEHLGKVSQRKVIDFRLGNDFKTEEILQYYTWCSWNISTCCVVWWCRSSVAVSLTSHHRAQARLKRLIVISAPTPRSLRATALRPPTGGQPREAARPRPSLLAGGQQLKAESCSARQLQLQLELCSCVLNTAQT